MSTVQEILVGQKDKQGEAKKENNYERVKVYLSTHSKVTDRDIAEALTMSTNTANKRRRLIQDAMNRVNAMSDKP
ncbi:hypothetical protein KSF_054450 [Reticulibacter mediterranei]|uniref:Uncharacterized protein n=1 Tax=Reticulibacter mediterranei TaxID=2778369 RepID=A0A8J3IR42_9CHLR|nr:hypothetical protein KSF_054450 [Reticulibacter mediterranei]